MDLQHSGEVRMKKVVYSAFFLILTVLILMLLSCGLYDEAVTVNIKGKAKEDKKKLTLMIYMAADNDLESYALSNLKAMERASFNNMYVLVLLDRAEGYDETNDNWTDTRVFEVLHDEGSGSSIKSKRLACPQLGLSASENTELDTGRASVLKSFLEFGKDAYEAENYALIIWGHGTGWRAVAMDDRTGSFMRVHELGAVLQNQNLCVIGFDTCFGGVIENVYELKNCSDYTVASPGLTPGSGWNYKRLLEKLSDTSAEGVLTSQTIAKSMAQSSSADMTIFINEKLEDLLTSIEIFSKSLADGINSNLQREEVFTSLFVSKSYRYTQYPCDLYLDLYSMADIYSDNPDVELAAAADDLKKKVKDATLTFATETTETTDATEAVYEAVQNGIGINFIPLLSAHITAASHSDDYIKNQNNYLQNAFIKDSEWWVPSYDGKSGSLLDKLFYTVY